jgi:predicted RNase H-like nuclease
MIVQPEKKHSLYTGVDGCKGGWLISTINDAFFVSVSLVNSLEEAIPLFNNSRFISIDMPMGLSESKEEDRLCDALIRKELGFPYSSSVFSVPCRQAVYAEDYETANQINKQILGKGVSKQVWNICSKIKELDCFVNNYPKFREKIAEAHPELCFKVLKSQNLNFKKREEEGIKERLHLLSLYIKQVQIEYASLCKRWPGSKVKPDDIVDSMVLAVNSYFVFIGKYHVFPEKICTNAEGIKMNVFTLNSSVRVSGI